MTRNVQGSELRQVLHSLFRSEVDEIGRLENESERSSLGWRSGLLTGQFDRLQRPAGVFAIQAGSRLVEFAFVPT